MPRGVSPKRERQYKHIKESAKRSGRYGGRAEEVAARTVNKIRREKGETKAQPARSSRRGRSSASAKSRSTSSSRTRRRATSTARGTGSRRRSSTSRRTSASGKTRRGFASMSESRQRAIARQGGQAAHRDGTAHEFSATEARQAGRKGGKAVSRNRAHMAEIGRKGGEH